MKLTDKLRRFAAEPKSAQTQEQTADLAFLQGQVVTNPFGSYYLIERTFALRIAMVTCSWGRFSRSIP